jgi:organic hydroperoxide reductase OsmC/OhrA
LNNDTSPPKNRGAANHRKFLNERFVEKSPSRLRWAIEERPLNVTATDQSNESTHPRDVTVDAVGDSLTTEVKYGALRWSLSGDDATASDPVSSFLGALGGCLLLSLRVAARVRKIDLGRASVRARANEKGHVKEIKVELQVESSAAGDQLDRLVEVAERGCHIRNLIRDEIAVALTVTRI